MPKKSFSPDIKLLALQYLEQGYTLQKVCKMFSVTKKNLQVWRAIYKHGGVEALVRPVKNKVYSKEFEATRCRRLFIRKLFSIRYSN